MTATAYLAKQDPLKLLLIAGVVIAGVYILKKGVAGAAAGAVSAVGDAAAGTVVGIGQSIGIPATNMTQCQADIAAGRRWDASFSCPAADFLGWTFGLSGPQYSQPASPTVTTPGGTFDYSSVVGVTLTDEEISRLRPRGGA